MHFDVTEIFARPEIVSGLFALLTTIVTGFMARSRINSKRLKEKLERAEGDIAFLLCVERVHCERNTGLLKSSHKNRTRAEAFKQGYAWSGSFTPGRVRASAMRDPSQFTTTLSAHVIVLLGGLCRAVAGRTSVAAGKARGFAVTAANRMRGKRSTTQTAT